MAIVLGPSFGEEIVKAGIGGLPFSWQDDGVIIGRANLTPAQNTTLDGVIAVHNPTTLPAVEQRTKTFATDPVRGDVVTHLKNDDLAQIEAYVRGKINASSVTDLASAKACMQRIENAMAGLTQAVALVVRE